jgi:hypothetical protein
MREEGDEDDLHSVILDEGVRWLGLGRGVGLDHGLLLGCHGQVCPSPLIFYFFSVLFLVLNSGFNLNLNSCLFCRCLSI